MEREVTIKCDGCGTINRSDARFCQKCGAALAAVTPFSAGSSPTPPGPTAAPKNRKGSVLADIVDEIEGMALDVRDAFSSLSKTLLGEPKRPPAPPKQAPQTPPAVTPGQTQPRLAQRLTAPTHIVSHLVTPKNPGEAVGGYVIQEAWPLQHSNYYRVRMERCPHGHINSGVVDRSGAVDRPGGQRPPEGGQNSAAARMDRCSTCQAELSVFLMRETDLSPRAASVTGETARHEINPLLQLSRSGMPGLLRLAAMFDLAGCRYAVSDYPGPGWQSLTQLELPVTDSALMAHWVLTLGKALVKLSEHGFTTTSAALADILEPVVIYRHAAHSTLQAAFADLSVFTPLRPTAAPPASQPPASPLAFLAQVLYTLASGRQQNRHRAPRDYSDTPPPFRGLLGRIDQNVYPDLPAFLDALRDTQQLPASGPPGTGPLDHPPASLPQRSLRQIAGYSTDTGKKRTHNEDFVGKYSLGMQQAVDAPEVGLYLVADGMGGHQAGELASRDVVRVILNEIQENVQELQTAPRLKRSTIKLDQAITAGDVLRSAVQQANRVLFNARQKRGSDRGTTLTAALVIGDWCAVANVGDSRTYLWRAGQLRQLTQDHSLVASLLAANMIRPDEVRTHPQRNQIYRTLGEKADVEVDIYECPLRQADRLLLCSDGLWEMVLDQEIHQLMLQCSNPQEVCDRLISAANLAGGEDNISVVSVWMA